MQLQEIMTTKMTTVGMDDRLGAVKDIFDTMGFHHLLVVGDDKTLCGVLSDRDLLRALSPHLGTLAETTRDSASLNRRVHQIMSHSPITLTSQATVADAIRLFLEHSVSCIPVVDEAFRPVGIVSWRDVLRVFVARGIAP
jgi:acetoin utilization protein AcuB